MLENLMKLVFGDPNKKELKVCQGYVDKINALYTAISGLSDARLCAKTQEFRLRLTKGETLDDLLPEDSEEVPEETGEFTVARTKNYAMRPMGVQEAIMQMNMLNHDFFVFFNAETEKIAIVYRRKSGDYGLINPELA